METKYPIVGYGNIQLSIVQKKDGLVHISYSYRTGENKKTIKHVSLNPNWIKGN